MFDPTEPQIDCISLRESSTQNLSETVTRVSTVFTQFDIFVHESVMSLSSIAKTDPNCTIYNNVTLLLVRISVVKKKIKLMHV